MVKYRKPLNAFSFEREVIFFFFLNVPPLFLFFLNADIFIDACLRLQAIDFYALTN